MGDQAGVAKVTRGAVFVSLQTALNYVAGLVFYMMAARLLPGEDIGSLSMLTFGYYAFLLIATTPTALSLPSAAVKYISEYVGRGEPEKASSVASAMARFILGLSAVALVVAVVLSSFFSSILWGTSSGGMVFALAFVAAFLAVVRTTYLSFLQGLQRFGRYAVAGFTPILVGRTAGVVLIILGYGLLGVSAGWLLGDLTGLAISLSLFVGLLPRSKRVHELKPLIAFGAPVLVFTSIFLFLDWVDRVLFLGLTSNLSDLGVYDLAIRGAQTLSIVWMAVSVTVFPALSNLYGRSGKEGFGEALKLSSRYLAYLIFPVAMGLAAMSGTAMAILFETRYPSGITALSVLALATIPWAFGMMATSALQALGQTRLFIRIGIVAMGLDIAVVVLATPWLGVIGAMLGRAAMMIAFFLLSSHALRRQIRFRLDTESLWKGGLAAALMAVCVGVLEFVVLGRFVSSAPLRAVLEIGSGLAVYGVAAVGLRALKHEDFALARRVLPQAVSPLLGVLERLTVR